MLYNLLKSIAFRMHTGFFWCSSFFIFITSVLVQQTDLKFSKRKIID